MRLCVDRSRGYDPERGIAVVHGVMAPFYWNPLRDDTNALRIAAYLRLFVSHLATGHVRVGYGDPGRFVDEPWGDDIYGAMRRAIVRGAAMRNMDFQT